MEKCICIVVFLALFHSSESQLPPRFIVEPARVTNLFTLLERTGETAREQKQQELIKEGKQDIADKLKQFLTVAVISEDELEQSKTWTQIPEDLTSGNQRVRVFINEHRYTGTGKGEQKALHGEMQFLNDENGLKKMIKQLEDDKGHAVLPYIIMFTLYIPCAHVSRLKYSCSEELANIAFTNDYIMLVGFSEVYEGTNEEKSREYMKSGAIQAFKKLANGPGFQRLYELHDDVKTTFQQYFHECLLGKPVADCCIADEEEERSRKIAAFVNEATKSCTENSEFAGLLTQMNRERMIKCVNKYIENNIGSDCVKCPNRNGVKIIVQFCAYSAIAIPGSPAFGVARDPYDTTWKASKGPWKDLYKNYLGIEHLPYFPCAKQTNDVKTLCTKMLEDHGPIPGLNEFQLGLKRNLKKRQQ